MQRKIVYLHVASALERCPFARYTCIGTLFIPALHAQRIVKVTVMAPWPVIRNLRLCCTTFVLIATFFHIEPGLVRYRQIAFSPRCDDSDHAAAEVKACAVHSVTFRGLLDWSSPIISFMMKVALRSTVGRCLFWRAGHWCACAVGVLHLPIVCWLPSSADCSVNEKLFVMMKQCLIIRTSVRRKG